MFRLVHAVILGLIGAGVVHIVVLFLMPEMSPRDAWSRLAEDGGLYAMTPYHSDSSLAGQSGVADPYFQAAACRFDLTDGIIHLAQDRAVPFWSASVYDRQGHNIYSLNDRTAQNGLLDLVVLTPGQMVDLRKSPLQEMEQAIFVETPITEGIIVVRGFQPDESWNRQVSEFLGGLDCAAEPI